MPQMSPAKMKKTVDAFNAAFPVGSWCVLRKDSDVKILTKVMHAAYILSGHTPVAFFSGVSGCYAVDQRVTRARVIEVVREDHRALVDTFRDAEFDMTRDVHTSFMRIPEALVYWQEIEEKRGK